MDLFQLARQPLHLRFGGRDRGLRPQPPDDVQRFPLPTLALVFHPQQRPEGRTVRQQGPGETKSGRHDSNDDIGNFFPVQFPKRHRLANDFAVASKTRVPQFVTEHDLAGARCAAGIETRSEDGGDSEHRKEIGRHARSRKLLVHPLLPEKRPPARKCSQSREGPALLHPVKIIGRRNKSTFACRQVLLLDHTQARGIQQG